MPTIFVSPAKQAMLRRNINYLRRMHEREIRKIYREFDPEMYVNEEQEIQLRAQYVAAERKRFKEARDRVTNAIFGMSYKKYMRDIGSTGVFGVWNATR